jgi:membrane peptidoglycan carboxypeptidase
VSRRSVPRLIPIRSAIIVLGEVAFLVGLLQSPRHLDPACDPERAAEARGRILERLAEAGRMSPSDLEALKARPLGTVSTCTRAARNAAGG